MFIDKSEQCYAAPAEPIHTDGSFYKHGAPIGNVIELEIVPRSIGTEYW